MKILSYIFFSIIHILWILIPIKENRWSLASWGGNSFSDNPRYLFKYIQSEHKNINAKFIVKNQNLVSPIDGVISAYSFSGIIHLITSEVIIFTHSAPWDFNKFFVNPKSFHCLTWHGRTVKKIHHQLEIKRIEKIKKRIFPFLNERIDMTICLHENEKIFLKDAFSINTSDIVPTGFPRNDIFFVEKKYKPPLIASDIIDLKIIYAPTYRNNSDNSSSSFENILDNFIACLEEELKDKKIKITMKLHPAQKISHKSINTINNSSIFELYDNKIEFNNSNLMEYDVLISDYSSIIFDFMLLKKHIILYQPDINFYKIHDKGFVDDMAVNKIILNSKNHQFLKSKDVANAIKNISEKHLRPSEEDISLVHQNFDSSSSKRLTEEINRRLNRKIQ